MSEPTIVVCKHGGLVRPCEVCELEIKCALLANTLFLAQRELANCSRFLDDLANYRARRWEEDDDEGSDPRCFLDEEEWDQVEHEAEQLRKQIRGEE